MFAGTGPYILYPHVAPACDAQFTSEMQAVSRQGGQHIKVGGVVWYALV
jgi:hypothetical protein